MQQAGQGPPDPASSRPSNCRPRSSMDAAGNTQQAAADPRPTAADPPRVQAPRQRAAACPRHEHPDAIEEPYLARGDLIQQGGHRPKHIRAWQL
jgi:hypothetical protein